MEFGPGGPRLGPRGRHHHHHPLRQLSPHRQPAPAGPAASVRGGQQARPERADRSGAVRPPQMKLHSNCLVLFDICPSWAPLLAGPLRPDGCSLGCSGRAAPDRGQRRDAGAKLSTPSPSVSFLQRPGPLRQSASVPNTTTLPFLSSRSGEKFIRTWKNARSSPRARLGGSHRDAPPPSTAAPAH